MTFYVRFLNEEAKRRVHPEMRDVKPGTKLMGVRFTQNFENSELNNRIAQIRERENDGN